IDYPRISCWRLDKLITVLPNNNVIMTAPLPGSDGTQIYKIDVNKAPPEQPLLTLDFSVSSIVSCKNNDFIVGTEDGRILKISENGHILFDLQGPITRPINHVVLLPDEKSFIYQSNGCLVLMNDDASIKAMSYINADHTSLLKIHNNCFITSTREGIEIRDLLNLNILKIFQIQDEDYQRVKFYFIEPIPGSPDEFYVAYQDINNDEHDHPTIARGNVNPQNREPLILLAELYSLNRGKR